MGLAEGDDALAGAYAELDSGVLYRVGETREVRHREVSLDELDGVSRLDGEEDVGDKSFASVGLDAFPSRVLSVADASCRSCSLP